MRFKIDQVNYNVNHFAMCKIQFSISILLVCFLQVSGQVEWEQLDQSGAELTHLVSATDEVIIARNDDIYLVLDLATNEWDTLFAGHTFRAITTTANGNFITNGFGLSKDNGKTWDITYTGPENATYLYNKNDTLIAYSRSPIGCDSLSVLRSVDKGESWSLLARYEQLCNDGGSRICKDDFDAFSSGNLLIYLGFEFIGTGESPETIGIYPGVSPYPNITGNINSLKLSLIGTNFSGNIGYFYYGTTFHEFGNSNSFVPSLIEDTIGLRKGDIHFDRSDNLYFLSLIHI